MSPVTEKVLTVEEQARQNFLKEDSLATGNLPSAPKRDPEAHRGLIKGVSLHRNDQKGTCSMKVEFRSTFNGKDYDYYLPIPKGYAANVKVDPNTLSTGRQDPNDPSRIIENEREQFAMRIANSDGTGEAQRLRYIAKQNGKSVPADAPPYENIEDWVELHNFLLTNLPVIATLKCDANPSDPQFANVLKLRGFFNEREVMANPKAMKGFLRTWEAKQ